MPVETPFEALVLRRGPSDFHTNLPVDLITGTGDDPRPRLRVDEAHTSFYENREFRAYHEFTIAAGVSVWLRWTFNRDVLVGGRALTLVAGQLRYALCTGGTPSGVWTGKTIHRVNQLTTAPAFTGNTMLESGGALSGGVERDVMLLNAGTGGNSATVESKVYEAGLAAGVYFVELRNNGAQSCTGVYNVVFEEYQPRSSRIR